MQFQVPQFTEAEDHIVGPLTIRQFIYIAAGAGISVMLYFMVATWLWGFLSIFIVGAALGFAFIKINGQSLEKVFLAAVQFYWTPQVYVWQPDQPQLPKNTETLRPTVSNALPVESIIGGMALKSAWRQIQVAGKPGPQDKQNPLDMTDHYEAFRSSRGDKQIARRVDYR
ncbi:MAG: PrgI family protein [bacterium]|nr:PrgI family protein [bacterium]